MFYVGVFFGISILGYKLCTIRVPTVLPHQYNENIFMHGYYSELEQSFLDLNKYNPIHRCWVRSENLYLKNNTFLTNVRFYLLFN